MVSSQAAARAGALSIAETGTLHGRTLALEGRSQSDTTVAAHAQ